MFKVNETISEFLPDGRFKICSDSTFAPLKEISHHIVLDMIENLQQLKLL